MTTMADEIDLVWQTEESRLDVSVAPFLAEAFLNWPNGTSTRPNEVVHKILKLQEKSTITGKERQLKMKLIFHFGVPKTGSSYIQSMLMGNEILLAQQGICIPNPGTKSLKLALKGHVNSGHGTTPNILPLVEECFTNGGIGGQPTKFATLMSSELWMKDMVERDGLFWKQIDSLPRGLEIQIIGFVRDPFWVGFSTWNQRVKRRKATKSFDEFLNAGWGGISQIGRVVSNAVDRGIESRILNYSRHHSTLWHSFLGLAGIDPTISSWKLPPVSIVNRSLHWAETVVAMEANRLGDWRSSPFIADAFCNYAPDVKPSGPALQKATFDTFVEKARVINNRINRWLPEAEKLNVGVFDPQWERAFFSQRHQSQINLPLASWRAIVKQVDSLTGSDLEELEDRLLHGLDYEIRADENDGSGYLFMAKNDVPQLVGNIRDIASQNSPSR